MFTRVVRHWIVGFGMATVAGVASAGALGFLETARGTGEIEYLETYPVLRGDLGEVVVAARRPETEVVVSASRLAQPALMAEIVVTAQRPAVRVADSAAATIAGLTGGALLQ